MKNERNIIGLAAIASLIFWVLDAAIDHLFLYDEPFLTLLLFNKKEVAFRLLASMGFFVFGFFMARTLARQKKAEELLKMEVAANAQAKESLHVSNQQQRAILSNIPDLAWLKDKEGRFVAVNEPFGKICGVRPEDLIGKTDFDIWPEDLAKAYRADDQEVMESGRKKQIDEPLVDSTGNMTWIETIKTPIYDDKGNIIGTTGIARDVTIRKRAIQELDKYRRELESLVESRTAELRASNRDLQIEVLQRRKSESDLSKALMELSNIMAAVPDIIYMLDQDGRLVKWNKTLETVCGYAPAELQGKPILDLLSENEREETYEKIKEAFEGGYSAREVKLLTKEGKPIPYFFSGAPYRDASGGVLGLVGVGKDMSESKITEEKINFLASIIQTIPEAVCSIDLEGNISFWNHGAEKMLGYTSLEILGKHISKIIPEELADIELKNCTDILNAEGYFVGYESVRMSKSGKTVTVEITGVALKDSEQKVTNYTSIMRDISERKRMVEDLLKTEKLESLAMLAGGIAHDFNNLLTALLGNISLSKRYVETGSTVYGILTDAEKALHRATDLTYQLLTFSKGGSPVKTVASLEELITDAADFALRGSNVICELDIPGNLRNVEVDKGQLSQVFHNLIINAQQAMPGGGTIAIRGENISIDKHSALPIKEGDYVKISIEDRGCGIPRENLQKIFDPYFTTKRQGSGLGLATSFSVIKKHGGHLTVASTPGAGSTFYIFLPSTDKKLPESIKKGKKLFRGKGRILAMDDEETILLVLMNMVTELGYEFASAANGEQAIDLYKKACEEGRPFDAVIADLTIRGGMGGQECIQHLLEFDPAVKAIVSSGYYDAPVMAHYRDYGFRDIITKPYQIEDLSEVLHRVLVNHLTEL